MSEHPAGRQRRLKNEEPFPVSVISPSLTRLFGILTAAPESIQK